MEVETVRSLYGVAGIIGILVLAWFGLMFVVSRFSDGIAESYDNVRRRLTPVALFLAWAVSALAMAGSLYFSEVANYTPCTLCWYQRIAMYPLVLILGIAAIRRDLSIRLYGIALAGVGAAISAYHIYVQWFQVNTAGCSVDAPCSQYWLKEFGFVSIPVLAFIAFLLVITFLLVPMLRSDDADEGEAGEAGDEVPDPDAA